MVNIVNAKSAIEYPSSFSCKCSTKLPWMWGPLLEVPMWEVDDEASWDRARGTQYSSASWREDQHANMANTGGNYLCVWLILGWNHCREQSSEIRGKEQAWPLTTYPADAKLSFNQQPWQKLRLKEGRETKDKEPIPASLDPLLHSTRADMYTVCEDYCRSFSSSIIIREVIRSGNYSYPHDPDDDHRH